MSRWIVGFLVASCVASGCGLTRSAPDTPLTTAIVYSHLGGIVNEREPDGRVRRLARLPAGNTASAVSAFGDDTLVVASDGLYAGRKSTTRLRQLHRWSIGTLVGEIIVAPDRTKVLVTAIEPRRDSPGLTTMTWVLLTSEPPRLLPPVAPLSKALGFTADSQSVLALVPPGPLGGTAALVRIALSTGVGQSLMTLPFGATAALSPDASHLAVAPGGAKLLIIDVASTGAPPRVVGLPEPANGVVWSPDSKTIFSGGARKRILKIALTEGIGTTHRLADGGAPIAVSPDGRSLLAVDGNHLHAIDTGSGHVSDTKVPIPGVFVWAQPALAVRLQGF